VWERTKRPERASERKVEERILLEKRRHAAARMDASRKKTVGARFDSSKKVRKTRDAR
jgi:hypothetical protein